MMIPFSYNQKRNIPNKGMNNLLCLFLGNDTFHPYVLGLLEHIGNPMIAPNYSKCLFILSSLWFNHCALGTININQLDLFPFRHG